MTEHTHSPSASEPISDDAVIEQDADLETGQQTASRSASGDDRKPKRRKKKSASGKRSRSGSEKAASDESPKPKRTTSKKKKARTKPAKAVASDESEGPEADQRKNKARRSKKKRRTRREASDVSSSPEVDPTQQDRANHDSQPQPVKDLKPDSSLEARAEAQSDGEEPDTEGADKELTTALNKAEEDLDSHLVEAEKELSDKLSDEVDSDSLPPPFESEDSEPPEPEPTPKRTKTRSRKSRTKTERSRTRTKTSKAKAKARSTSDDSEAEAPPEKAAKRTKSAKAKARSTSDDSEVEATPEKAAKRTKSAKAKARSTSDDSEVEATPEKAARRTKSAKAKARSTSDDSEVEATPEKAAKRTKSAKTRSRTKTDKAKARKAKARKEAASESDDGSPQRRSARFEDSSLALELDSEPTMESAQLPEEEDSWDDPEDVKLAVASEDLLDIDMEHVEELDESDFARIEEDESEEDESEEDESEEDESEEESEDEEPQPRRGKKKRRGGKAADDERAGRQRRSRGQPGFSKMRENDRSNRRASLAKAWGKPKSSVVAQRRKTRGRLGKESEKEPIGARGASHVQRQPASKSKLLIPVAVMAIMVIALVGLVIALESSNPTGPTAKSLMTAARQEQIKVLHEHNNELLAATESFYKKHPERAFEALGRFRAIISTLDEIRRYAPKDSQSIESATGLRSRAQDWIEKVSRQRETEGRGAYDSLNEEAGEKERQGDLLAAVTVLDGFPVHLRDLAWWHRSARVERERLRRAAAALEDSEPLLEKARLLADEGSYEEALGVLAAFSNEARGTAAHRRVEDLRSSIQLRRVRLADAATKRDQAREKLRATSEKNTQTAEERAALEEKFATVAWEPLLGDDLFNWQLRNPPDSEWRLNNGILKGRNIKGQPSMLGTRQRWMDYVAEFKVRVVRGSYQVLSRLNLTPAGQGNMAINLKSTPGPGDAGAGWQTVQVWVIGDSVEISVDGGEKQSVSSQDQNPVPAGGLGFGLAPGSEIELRDIQVKVLKAE